MKRTLKFNLNLANMHKKEAIENLYEEYKEVRYEFFKFCKE